MGMVHSVLNFWRGPTAYRDGSVPGWLEVGTMALMPPIDPSARIQSLVDKMPPSIRNSPHLFPTIEHGGTTISLKIGQYKLKHSKKKREPPIGNTINCLQVTGHPKIDQILIHDAWKDSSNNLAGCIAPGMKKKTKGPGGVLQSAKAMEEIWKLLGGYRIGTEVTLNIWSNTPGETRTIHNWGKTN